MTDDPPLAHQYYAAATAQPGYGPGGKKQAKVQAAIVERQDQVQGSVSEPAVLTGTTQERADVGA